MRRPLRSVLLIALGFFPLIAVGSWAVGLRRLQADLELSRLEIERGRHARALEILARLDARGYEPSEVRYRLGLCERALGRPEAAEEAWDAVPPGSRYAREAASERAELLIRDLGRFADAEPLLEDLIRGKDAVSARARMLLARLYFWQGRNRDARSVLIAGWSGFADRAQAIRDVWAIDHDPTTRETMRSALERASACAPGDDRVWLGLATLATRSGRYDEAERRLVACLERRPDDPAVWRARLEWAVASGRVERARDALAHLKAGDLSAVEVLSCWAWLAGEREDAVSERRAVEALRDRAPGDPRVLERLAVLAARAGETDRAAELRRRKRDVDESLEQYRRRMDHLDPRSRGGWRDLARLSESLGRWFETRAWWTLADATDDERRAAFERLDRAAKAAEDLPAGWTLADLRAAEVGDGRGIASPSPPASTAIVPPDFEDRAEAVGLRFVYDNGRSPTRHLPETMGGGVGLLDYDGDGWLDVYCVQGGPFPPGSASVADPPGDRLFRNRGDGTFEDATEAAGIARMPRGYGQGVTVGDVDNDGRPDLFVTRWRSYALYRNRGDGTFEDATDRWGLGGDRDWPTSAAFADLDGDGRLDLYVCHYLEWDAENPPPCGLSQGGERTYCDPRTLKALPDHLFRNEGGRFRDVTAEAAIVDADGPGLGVVAADLDDDGDLDLYVANDTTANYLFRNLGGFRFEEIGAQAGVASAATGGYQAGMGVAVGDLDGDGRPDLAVTNFYGESTTLYRNLGDMLFADQSAAAGLTAPTRSMLGFGIAFLDYNADGRLDVAIANGHVNDFRPLVPYAMPAQILAGTAAARLIDVSGDNPGRSPWASPRIGRGLAAGDLDNDGRIDLLLVSQTEPLAYFHNRTKSGRSATFRLVGTTSNRDAVGAKVTVVAGGRRQHAWRFGGGSYLSASDPRIVFGLGDVDRIDEVEVRWPSGRVDRHRDLPARGCHVLTEGGGAVQVP